MSGLIEYEYISRCLRFISTLSVYKAVKHCSIIYFTERIWKVSNEKCKIK